MPLPLPDWPLIYRVGAVGSVEVYEQIGGRIAGGLLAALPDDWSFDGKDVLDFGAGAGRVLRHFVDSAQAARSFVAADIDGPSVEWLQRHLESPFSAIQTGELPPLPFEPESFDLVYVASVFTHLPHTWEEWLRELRRVTRPGAYVLASFMGPRAYDIRRRRPFPDVGMLVENEDEPWDRGGPQVLHDPEWIDENWGRIFDVEANLPRGLDGWQSLAVLRTPG